MKKKNKKEKKFQFLGRSDFIFGISMLTRAKRLRDGSPVEDLVMERRERLKVAERYELEFRDFFLKRRISQEKISVLRNFAIGCCANFHLEVALSYLDSLMAMVFRTLSKRTGPHRRKQALFCTSPLWIFAFCPFLQTLLPSSCQDSTTRFSLIDPDDLTMLFHLVRGEISPQVCLGNQVFFRVGCSPLTPFQIYFKLNKINVVWWRENPAELSLTAT